jgi:hypothetical protein
VNHLDVHVPRKGVHHLLCLVQAQQAVIHEYAGELLADRPVDQCRGHRRIHAARQAEDDFLVFD